MSSPYLNKVNAGRYLTLHYLGCSFDLNYLFKLRWLVYSLYTFINNTARVLSTPTLSLSPCLVDAILFNLARRYLSKTFAELANIHLGGFPS